MNTTEYEEKTNNNIAVYIWFKIISSNLLNKFVLLDKFYNLNNGNNLSSKIFDHGISIDRHKWYSGIKVIFKFRILLANYNIIDELKSDDEILHLITLPTPLI